MAHLLFVAICLIWGTSFLLMKKAKLCFGNLDVATWRVLGGAAALWLLWTWQRRHWPLAREHAAPLLLLAGVGYALPFWIQPYVIGQVQAQGGHGSAFAGMMVSPVPLLTILVSIPMLGVWPTTRQVLGVVGGLLCLGLLFAEELRHSVRLVDLLLAAVTPLAYALANTYVKRRFASVPAIVISFSAMALSGMMLLPAVLLRREWDFAEHGAVALSSLAVLGVLCTGVAGFWFYKLIHQRGPLYAGMVAYVIPGVAVIMGWLDGEQMSALQLVALAGIVVMVALVQSAPAEAGCRLEETRPRAAAPEAAGAERP